MSDYIWVGLDVHVESITAAILEGDSQEAEVIKLSGDLNKVRRLMRRLSKKGPGALLLRSFGIWLRPSPEAEKGRLSLRGDSAVSYTEKTRRQAQVRPA